MSGKITLESRQRLPTKIQDVICDAALVMQHAATAAGSSDVLNTSAKQVCAVDQVIGATAAMLNKLDTCLDAMAQQYDEIEEKIPLVSDVVATVQVIERNKFFTEEARHPYSDSDADGNS
ncbi:hypothetical protein V3C99_012485 [Haemonchus contortus]|uniref:BLOC-1-related complex subunit 7 n=1 Tax=Haemonchus contortus TaxID=6289 RepID=A0A7I4Y4V5_HAECO|nr:Protein R03A10.1 [Haemonchus contortus]